MMNELDKKILELFRYLINSGTKHLSEIDYSSCSLKYKIDGKEISSVEFASKIENIFNINSNITFIIGGSYGLDDEIKKLSNYKLSFSKMTFPHQLFRLLFLEQLYRSYKIINNEEYHK